MTDGLSGAVALFVFFGMVITLAYMMDNIYNDRD